MTGETGRRSRPVEGCQRRDTRVGICTSTHTHITRKKTHCRVVDAAPFALLTPPAPAPSCGWLDEDGVAPGYGFDRSGRGGVVGSTIGIGSGAGHARLAESSIRSSHESSRKAHPRGLRAGRHAVLILLQRRVGRGRHGSCACLLACAGVYVNISGHEMTMRGFRDRLATTTPTGWMILLIDRP